MKDKIHKNKIMKYDMLINISHLSCHGDGCVFQTEALVESKILRFSSETIYGRVNILLIN